MRLASLLLLGRPDQGGGGAPPATGVADVVGWLGALQAQDAASGAWSLGVRLPGFTQVDVDAALERREALRTWPMRGTVHLVPARDARWMLQLMAARPLAAARSRRAGLGITEATVARAAGILGEALAGGRRLTRSGCAEVLEAAGIPTAGQRLYHLLLYASQAGVTCIAPNVGKEQSFALLDEWVSDPHRPERDEALATIALRYFRSHGPARAQDFAAWTGLVAADVRAAIALAGPALVACAIDGVEHLGDPALLDAGRALTAAGVRSWTALPGFDELLLGYRERRLVLAAEHVAAVVPGGNGVFQATLVRDGEVVGTWRRSLADGRADVRVLPLVRLPDVDRPAVEAALDRYARFTGLPLRVRWPD